MTKFSTCSNSYGHLSVTYDISDGEILRDKGTGGNIRMDTPENTKAYFAQYLNDWGGQAESLLFNQIAKRIEECGGRSLCGIISTFCNSVGQLSVTYDLSDREYDTNTEEFFSSLLTNWRRQTESFLLRQINKRIDALDDQGLFMRQRGLS